jgi:hypothetical protein
VSFIKAKSEKWRRSRVQVVFLTLLSDLIKQHGMSVMLGCGKTVG